MTTVFMIREKGSGAFLTSVKYKTFGMDIGDASQFTSRKNAEKAIRGLFWSEGVNPYGGDIYSIHDGNDHTQCYHHHNLQEYIQLLESKDDKGQHDNGIQHLKANGIERRCETEVVEVQLTYTIVG